MKRELYNIYQKPQWVIDKPVYLATAALSENEVRHIIANYDNLEVEQLKAVMFHDIIPGTAAIPYVSTDLTPMLAHGGYFKEMTKEDVMERYGITDMIGVNPDERADDNFIRLCASFHDHFLKK